jgi:hypothetical protein
MMQVQFYQNVERWGVVSFQSCGHQKWAGSLATNNKKLFQKVSNQTHIITKNNKTIVNTHKGIKIKEERKQEMKDWHQFRKDTIYC